VSRRVNLTTFLIIEDDRDGEQPHIYVKIYPNHLLITDTGSNIPRSKEASFTSLRQYLEAYPIPSNSNKCLNEDSKKKYIIICSHCHSDHILGIPQFLSAERFIIASSFQPSFILEDLPTHSLCKYLGVPTPKYTITHWVRNLSYLEIPDEAVPLRIQFLHIPGHTPDSLAWYDIDEHFLYVGDAFYERERSVPIPELPGRDEGGVTSLRDHLDLGSAVIFPEEGNLVQFMSSMDFLHSFVMHKNGELRRRHQQQQDPSNESRPPRVQVCSGHMTYGADAEVKIIGVKTLFQKIIDGKIPVRRSQVERGVILDFWAEEVSKYSVLAPRRLVEEAREHFGRQIKISITKH
jgi:glyoxylase-like metal-dependent hydrolase (beta-lactamase superfamily II)